MRPRSVIWPLTLLAIGVFFLLNNLRPDLVSLAKIADYWPFFLIGLGVIGLIEVLFYASRGANPPPHPLGGGAIFWILAVAILISVAGRNHNFRGIRIRSFDSPGISFFGSDFDYDVNVVEPSQGVTRVVLDNLHGNLTLRGGGPGALGVGDVKVTGHKSVRALNRNDADRADQQTHLHVEREGDSLVIRTDDFNGPQLIRISDDLDITIPGGVSVESLGRAGDLTIDGVDGPIDVASGRGDIRLSHIAKDVRIEASRSGDVHATDLKGSFELQGRGGDVQLENIEEPVTINGEYDGMLSFRGLAKPMRFNSSRTEFRVEAIPGSISMDLGNLKLTNVLGPVNFKTGTRDIQATDVSEALDLTVNRGDVQISIGKSPVPKMDVHTRNGDITLALPPGAEFQVDGSTSHGEIENEYGGLLQVESSGHSATIRGHAGHGPLVTVGTDRGTVTIKKN